MRYLVVWLWVGLLALAAQPEDRDLPKLHGLVQASDQVVAFFTSASGEVVSRKQGQLIDEFEVRVIDVEGGLVRIGRKGEEAEHELRLGGPVIQPAEPAEPVEPAEPMAPPRAPQEPTGPTEPPDHPAEPTEPTEPASPEEVVAPPASGA